MQDVSTKAEGSLVLVVDDDEMTRFVLGEALGTGGFVVETAENGKEALDKFEALRPDIVLLDVMMPDMNGFEVCGRIRSARGGKHVPIVMVTGVDDIDSIKQAFQAGATDFITKPINLIVLNERIRYMLRAGLIFENFRRSEARLATAQRIAHMGSWEVGLEKNEFHCSDETYFLLGMEPDGTRLGRKAFLRFVHPEDRDSLNNAVNIALKKGKAIELDHRILLPDRGERIVSHRIEVLFDSEGNPQHIAGTVQDITVRKRMELLEAERNQILEIIISGEPLKNILMRLVTMVEQLRPEAICSLFTLHGNQLLVGASLRMPLKLARAFDGLLVGPRNGCSGSCVYFGQKTVVHDVCDSPLWENYRQMAVDHGIRASLSMPILSGRGRILGAITLLYPEPGPPPSFDHNLVEIACKLAAVGIEQRQMAKQLAHQAHHDALTGLPNRVLLSDRLNLALAQAQRYEKRVAVIYIDLDRFKHVNDFLGHHVGDMLLKEIADRLRSCTRKSDTLARMGGDEFMLVLVGVTDDEDISQTGQRLLDVLKEPVIVENHELHVGASIGISIYPDDGLDASTLQRHADIAMYCAKNDGGNRFQFFTAEMNAVVIERLELENDLRKALERNEFELHYQPQYDMVNNRLVGVESLIRWNHPELGCIPPARFIPIAEETGLIVPIGRWVLREACRKNYEWQLSGFEPFKVAVNVSALQLSQADFADMVLEVLKETGLDPRWLELEVTESVLMKDVKSVSKSLVSIRSEGVSVAIDDFGNGYSSMSYLQWLPVDCLKIDQSFIHELGHVGNQDQRTKTLIKTFVNLAANLNLKLLAEGVESSEQCHCLKEVGCELGQGFLFNVPMSCHEIEEVCLIKSDSTFMQWLENRGGNGNRQAKRELDG